MYELKLFTMNKMLFFLLISISAYAQDVLDQDLIRGTVFKSFDLGGGALVGTPYINEEFLPAKINDGKVLYFMRYDAYTNQMEAQQEDGIYLAPMSYNVTINFTTTDKTYQVFDYFVDGEFTTEFFVVLTKGRHKLLVLEDVKFFEGVKTRSTLKEDTPPTLKRVTDKFFVSQADHNAVELPRKKNDFLSLFKKDAEKIEAFMKKEKLGNKSKEDLIKIFEFYNAF